MQKGTIELSIYPIQSLIYDDSLLKWIYKAIYGLKTS